MREAPGFGPLLSGMVETVTKLDALERVRRMFEEERKVERDAPTSTQPFDEDYVGYLVPGA